MNERHSSSRGSGRVGLPLEIVAIWAFVAFESLAILVTSERSRPSHTGKHTSDRSVETVRSERLEFASSPRS